MENLMLLPSRRIFFFAFALVLSVIIKSLSLPTTAAMQNYTDKLALLAFKSQMVGGPSQILTSWNDSLHFCNWAGVTCGKRHPHRVVFLNLSSHSLAGPLSPHLANLTFLTTLDLSRNSFYGEIPTQISRLFRLRNLNLSRNSIEGEVPRNLSKQLRYLHLDRNHLTGSIPYELTSLPKLLSLALQVNNLMGRIPPSFGNMSNLEALTLGDNRLDGSIPDDLGWMKNIRQLLIGGNTLSGVFPSSLYNHSSLQRLVVDQNDLQGRLPPDLGLTLPNLRLISMGQNKFSGHIPVSLANASRLEVIQLSHNPLTGSVPRSLGSLNGLRVLGLHNNSLSSSGSGEGLSFITSLTNCTLLRILLLAGNNLTGALPASVANLSTQLERLRLDENLIYGAIPTGIENLVSLNLLALRNNFLEGNIPITIGRLGNLQGLYLEKNKLSGHIPSSLGNITGLNKLFLNSNQLEGGIPPSLGDCKQLQYIGLDRNKLNGAIPNRVMSLSNIILFSLSNNFLTGILPPEIGDIKGLNALDVSNNRLSGEIPSILGNCLDLRDLRVRGNSLQGPIPAALSTLKNIEIMDLSANNLSGTIPNFFENFSFLLYLNFSFNDLEGEMPKQGVFANVSAISVVGNKKLCGGTSELQLPLCPRPKSRKKHLKVIISVVSCLVVLALLSCSIGALYLLRRLRKEPISTSPIKDFHLNLSYAELLKATDGFSKDRLIGVGSYSSVFKGSLEKIEGFFAVKVLNLQLQEASKSFEAECKVLRNIKHRNLVKILTVCSSIDFNGNDFKALVFEYMAKGTLEKWLHQNNFDGQDEMIHLNFVQRLNIAIDVASALDYLHHHYDVPIIHRDLKPSNVLLDDDMCAYVSDFGLAKFLLQVTSNCSQNRSSSIGIKGTIGYVAPEYAMGRQASTHGDVYSYGILLLELFTGKSPTNNEFGDNFSLREFAKMAWPERVLEIIDPRLLPGVPYSHHNDTNKMQESLALVIKVGLSCSADSPSERMDIGSVSTELHAARNLYLAPVFNTT